MAAIGMDEAGAGSTGSAVTGTVAAGAASSTATMDRAAANAAGVAAQVWMPVKHAAREAGVPDRSAFRWAKKGVIPVRRSGKVQLVEVGMLKAYASRPVNAEVAPSAATVAMAASAAPAAATTSRVDEVAKIADWDERICALETVMEDLWMAVFGGKGAG